MPRPTAIHSDPEPPPIAPREWVTVLVLVLLGVALRCAWPGRMAVEHFDEGVYASNLFFDAGGYPDRHLYAPPLLPTLIEFALVLGGPSNFSAMLPSLCAGCLTPLLVWWIARDWFGSPAGLAAAALAALSDFHAAFSRTALTDVLLGFWLLLAVYWFSLAVHRGGYGWAIAAGLATSAAWWTKYNGWLPIAIAGAGVAGWILFARPARPLVFRALIAWMVMAVVAGGVWAPHVAALQPVGGYAAVAANHRGYLAGPLGWPTSFVQQADNLRFYDGLATLLGLAAAVWLTRTTASRGGVAVLLAAMVMGGLVWLLGSPGLLLACAVWGLILHQPWSSGPRTPASGPAREEDPALSALGGWLVAAWLIGLTLATPLYYPYPRLTIPWLIAAWLAAAAGLAVRPVARKSPPTSPAQALPVAPDHRSLVLAIALAGLFAVPGLWQVARIGLLPGGLFPAWEDRSGVVAAAERAATEAGTIAVREGKAADEVLLFVYRDPGLLFQLRLRGLPVVLPAGSLKFAPPEVAQVPYSAFVIATRFDQTDETGMSPGAEAPGPLSAEWSSSRSHIVALDVSPAAVRHGGLWPVEERVYRLR